MDSDFTYTQRLCPFLLELPPPSFLSLSYLISTLSFSFTYVQPYLDSFKVVTMASTHNFRDIGFGKAAHVNVMTDVIIANLPPLVLRSMLRSLLDRDPCITPTFNTIVTEYLARTEPRDIEEEVYISTVHGRPTPTLALEQLQTRYRCLMGCGDGFESLKCISEVVWQTRPVVPLGFTEDLRTTLAVVDADLVQAITAVEKERLLTKTAPRSPLSADESRKAERKHAKILYKLLVALLVCKRLADQRGHVFVFERGLTRLLKLDYLNMQAQLTSNQCILAVIPQRQQLGLRPTGATFVRLESFLLGQTRLPRIFMGLWQFSSPAWGTATKSKIHDDFRKHVNAGFLAYGMSASYLMGTFH